MQQGYPPQGYGAPPMNGQQQMYQQQHMYQQQGQMYQQCVRASPPNPASLEATGK
jgi:hypothetical protein